MPPISLADQARRARSAFEDHFGRPPKWLAAAPGRVSLLGGHTDYNDGYVLPMAIECYTVVAGDLSADDLPQLQAYSAALDQTATMAYDAPPGDGEANWCNYVLGVLAGCHAAGQEFGGLDLAIDSTVPVGGGLSSSAALEVAVATLVEAISGRSLDPKQKALLCQQAEHDYAGVPCGIMDQFTSVLGQKDHLMLLDCRSQEFELVALDDPTVSMLIVNSNVSHELSSGEYSVRRQQCEKAARLLGVASLRDATQEQLNDASGSLDSVLLKRARHVISENQRTYDAAAAFRENDWSRLGELMHASHASLRDDFEVSCDELDLLVEIAQQIGSDGGIIGAQMTGGGFGGCTVSVVHTDALTDVVTSVGNQYRKRTGIEASIFATRPARGAHVLEMA
ncbi:MAG: galactokinase [Pirellulales bacterium]|nr:galactokinase [Pirellulales bacterium]